MEGKEALLPTGLNASGDPLRNICWGGGSVRARPGVCLLLLLPSLFRVPIWRTSGLGGSWGACWNASVSSSHLGWGALFKPRGNKIDGLVRPQETL